MMMESLNELEVLKIAKGIEEEGFRFYSEAAGKYDQGDIRAMFQHLAEEEQEHTRLFQEIYDKTVKAGAREEDYLYDEVVASYIHAISETAVFNTKGLTNSRLKSVDNARDALLMGMQAEKDAILFYEAILKHTRLESTKKILNDLIEEEMRHLHKLKLFIERLGE